MKLSYPHGTTKARALDLLKTHGARFAENLAPEVSEVRQEWHDDALDAAIKVFGLTIKGRLVVEERTVEMEVDLPWLARPREGEIRSRALHTLDEVFGSEDNGKERAT